MKLLLRFDAKPNQILNQKISIIQYGKLAVSGNYIIINFPFYRKLVDYEYFTHTEKIIQSPCLFLNYTLPKLNIKWYPNEYS